MSKLYFSNPGRIFVFTITTLGLLLIHPHSAEAIGKKEFFEYLQESWNNIQTFQADVIQESRYSDGVVQRYSGKLALGEDGRIAYDYQLTGEFHDPSLIAKNPKPKSPAQTDPNSLPPTKERKSSGNGSYRAQGELVVQYNPDQNVLVESPEDETLLIQVFRSMLGSGNFDVEKFKTDYKIGSIEDLSLEDGTKVYRLIATPRKGSDVYNWISQSGNAEIDWQQELWVEQATMRPIKAVLLSDKESTSVQLKNAKLNQPVDPKLFMLPVKEGQVPPKYSRGSSRTAPKTLPGPNKQEFDGVPLEEIPVEK